MQARGLWVAGTTSAQSRGSRQRGAGGGEDSRGQARADQGQHAQGEVTFTQEAGGVRVVGSFSGLKMGEHGFHVHEKGDCSAPDGASAGGHFNPSTKPHGARDVPERHVGDLGNLKADPYGLARVDFVDTQLSLSGRELDPAESGHRPRQPRRLQDAADRQRRRTAGLWRRSKPSSGAAEGAESAGKPSAEPSLEGPAVAGRNGTGCAMSQHV